MHPLIEKTRKGINKAHLDKGCISCNRDGLNVRVSPNSLDRALKIMDTLLKTLEAKGISVSIKEENYKNKTCVAISGMTFGIDMYEKINIVKKKEKDRFDYNQYDYIPNGKLVLRIKNAPSNTRSEWIDGDKKKLEDLLDSFVDGLHRAVVREKELEKERLKWHEEYLKKEEDQKIAEIEEERFRALEKEAISWQRGKLIRSYIEAVTAAYIKKNRNIEPGSEFDKWRAWAQQRANRFDPLTRI